MVEEVVDRDMVKVVAQTSVRVVTVTPDLAEFLLASSKYNISS